MLARRVLKELDAAGYELVDAFHRERINPGGSYGTKTYYVARFVFVRREFVRASEEFRRIRSRIWEDLTMMCEQAMWRVRAFSNPFFEKGEEVLGQRMLSINLEARKPLYQPGGSPILVWDRDKRGERVGECSHPLRPTHALRLMGNAIMITPLG